MSIDAPAARSRLPVYLALSVILAAGIFLRVCPLAGFHGIGFDENLYRRYVTLLSVEGLAKYPDICESYVAAQKEMPSAILPPTRFLYIFCSWLWHEIVGSGVMPSLHAVSALFTILTLLLSAMIAKRMAGDGAMLGVTALMSCAPTQIHMAQHALIDGFFAFWALLTVWALWENLRAPNHPGWLTLYALSGALMVTVKENSAFVYVAIGGLILANHWLKFGKVTTKLLLVTAAGPLLGLAILVNLAGGLPTFLEIYRLLVAKAYNLEYAIRTGDGPWYRYLVDLMIVSPVILMLSIAQVFQITREKKAHLYFTAFIAGSYLIMCNIKYGMNLRYANMWDMPMRFLAFSKLGALCGNFGTRKTLMLVLAVVALCCFDLHQYYVSFVWFPMYELVPEGLLRAVRILK